MKLTGTDGVTEATRFMGTGEVTLPTVMTGILGRIDQYLLLKELGGGGFGVVYLARDTVAGFEVAVKGLPPLVKNNADELERIRENFALVSKLHHPHIAAALVLHPAKEVAYADERVRQSLRVVSGDTLMVMAYAPGVTLSKWRKQFPGGKVPVAQALEVCRQIAAALDYAHAERVVHRDVKPSNIIVERKEKELSVKVLDFGIAAEIRSSMSRVSREQGDTSGTRPYMAPEQWAGKRQDGRTDQYALAVLFYELVSGAVPFASAFDTADPVIMMTAVENKKPEQLSELTKEQNAALLRGLGKVPAQRFLICSDFVSALAGEKSRPVGWNAGWTLASVGFTAAAILVMVMLKEFKKRETEGARQIEQREQTEKLDAAQKEKVAGLRAAAEKSLATGDLEVAEARIAEFAQDGSAEAAAELRKKYESKVGEREANKRYAAASVAREEALKLDAGQGFGEKLKALEVVWRKAEAARQGGGWGQALSGYDAVIAECKRLTELDVSRQSAKTHRDVAEKAKTDAENAMAAKDAEVLFADGSQTSAQAAAAFEKGDFDVASKAWKEAAAYASAQKRAVAVQEVRKKADAEQQRLAKEKADADALPSAAKVKALQSKKADQGSGTRAAYNLGDVETVDLGGGAKLELAWCPAGSFMMGSPLSESDRDKDETQHRVTLTRGFWLGKAEVTQRQWVAVMGANPSNLKGANLPVDMVSWHDCQEFIRKLNEKLETENSKLDKFRLPTEAEWEYACRAGTTTKYYYGTSLVAGMANFGKRINCSQPTTPVGFFKPNAWSLYDMHGNVWEWCQDWCGDYPHGNATDPSGSGSGVNRVFRGGSWGTLATFCRSATRGKNTPDYRISTLGLRLARDASVQEFSDTATMKDVQAEQVILKKSGPSEGQP